MLIRDQWERVRKTEASLSDPVWMAVQGKPVNGVKSPIRIVEMPRYVAARAIVWDGERLATPQEREAHLAECARAKMDAAADALRRAGITVTIVPRSERAGGRCD